MVRNDVCEKLSAVCVALFGLASASTLGLATTVLGVGAAGLAIPAVIQKLRGAQTSGLQSTMVKLQSGLLENFDVWALTGDIQVDLIAPMEEALAGVLPRLNPSCEQLIATGRNNRKLASLVIIEATSKAPQDFEESTDPQIAFNRRALESLVVHALDQLDGDLAFEAKMMPWFQREVLNDLGALKDGQSRIEAEVSRLAEAMGQQAKVFGIKEGMLIEVARRYANGNPNDFDSALRGLEEALVAYHDMQRTQILSNMSNGVDNILQIIDDLNDIGEIDGAQQRIDQEIAVYQLESQRRKSETIRLYEKGIAQSILARDAKNVCRYIISLFDLNSPANDAFLGLLHIQHEWFTSGQDKGLNFDLEVSIEIARTLVVRATRIFELGVAYYKLGNALEILGERETNTLRLDEALRTYEVALQYHTQEQFPSNWAMVQNSRGNAFSKLGERLGDNKLLKKALVAYQLALIEHTQERAPADWAMTQSNLGTALQVLGVRESDKAQLEESIIAYRAALKGQELEKRSLQWAQTQNNLGNSLSILGDSESDVSSFEEAISAYNAALEVRKRILVPLDWAHTQNNLGNAFIRLYERNDELPNLEKGLEAYKSALEERTRSRVPLDWAVTQANLSAALRRLGEHQNDVEQLGASIVASCAALEESTRERVPLEWARVQNNLGAALQAVGERDARTFWYEDALVAYRAALEEYTKERMPFHWALTHQNMAMVLGYSYETSRDETSFASAIEALDKALSVFAVDQTSPQYRKATVIREVFLELWAEANASSIGGE